MPADEPPVANAVRARLYITDGGDVIAWNPSTDTEHELAESADAVHPDLATHNSLGLATDAELAAHTGDTADAHDASAVSVVPFGAIAADNVQAALEEIVAESGGAHPDLATHDGLGLATDAELAAHTGDTVDAHDASAVSFAPAGGIAATDVQAAIQELDTEKAATHSHPYEASGAVATHAAASDPHTGYIQESLFDAKGDIIAASAADTPARLAAGSNDSVLMADSAQTAGLKWATPATPSTQAFGDAASEGTADSFTRGDHKHAMPANPVTAHEAASDPHTGYVQESLLDAKGDLIAASAADTPVRQAVGANDTILMADSAQSSGLKWASPGTPSTQAFGDAAAEGTTDGYTRTDHKHAMPANPVTAHEAASDPHTGYQKESEKGAASGYASLDSGTKVPTAELGGAGADNTKFLRGDQTWAAPTAAHPDLATHDTLGLATQTELDNHLNDTSDAHDGSAVSLSSITGLSATELQEAVRELFEEPYKMFRYRTVYRSEFIEPTSSTRVEGLVQAGTGATWTDLAAEADRPGIWRFGTGTAATNQAYLHGPASTLYMNGRYRFGIWLRIPTLSTSTQRFAVAAGVFNTTDPAAPASPGDNYSIYFVYRDNVNSGAWQGVVVKDTATAVNTLALSDNGGAITVGAGTWYRLEWETTISGSDMTVTFYIDGVQKGSLTLTATHMNGTQRLRFGIFKSVGNTERTLDVDAWYFMPRVTR